jgi:hypothetical protein
VVCVQLKGDKSKYDLLTPLIATVDFPNKGNLKRTRYSTALHTLKNWHVMKDQNHLAKALEAFTLPVVATKPFQMESADLFFS